MEIAAFWCGEKPFTATSPRDFSANVSPTRHGRNPEMLRRLVQIGQGEMCVFSDGLGAAATTRRVYLGADRQGLCANGAGWPEVADPSAFAPRPAGVPGSFHPGVFYRPQILPGYLGPNNTSHELQQYLHPRMG